MQKNEQASMVGEILMFDPELYEIGRLLDPKKKSRRLQGRYDLAVNALSVWHEMQIELRDEEGVPSLKELIEDELKEVEEKKELECELAMDNNENHKPWYERKRASEYWEVANEMADVTVLLISEMLMDGLGEKEVFDALRGVSEHRNKDLINQMIARTAVLGMDLAEIMILKTEVNMQHRDPALLAWVRGNGYMKGIRRMIGNEDSQIPHLAQGFLGETVLTRLQAPSYATGAEYEAESVYKLFYLLEIVKGNDELLMMVDDDEFGGLYRV